jgi:hypothetical protein
MGKRRITVVLAAMFLAAGVSAAGATTATAATALPAHTAVSHGKPAKLDPFTGKLTTQYSTKRDGAETTTYYLWPYAANTKYCAEDSGGYTGAPLELFNDCNTSLSNDMWTTVKITSGTYDSYQEIKSEDGLCIDDAGGADNVQILMENCAVVGGQAWILERAWLNGINYVVNKAPYQAITLDYGTVKNGAWIVTNNYYSGTVPTAELWAGP